MRKWPEWRGALLVSMAALFFQAVVTLVAIYFFGLTEERPDSGSIGIVVVILLPLAAVLGALAGLAFTFSVVFPTALLARWLALRTTGRDVWWWMPLVTLALVGVLWALWAVAGDGPAPGVFWWLYAAVVLTVTALAARWSVLRSRVVGGSGGSVLLAVGAGVLAVVLAIGAGAGAYGTGLAKAYAPPRLTITSLTGTWSDGHGGTLRLAPGGAATAAGLDVDADVYGFGRNVSADLPANCDGIGTWRFAPGDGHWSQVLTLDVQGCDGGGDAKWYVLGTSERPKIYRFNGDPDSWDLYVLTKRP
ncbi:hypothetical protein [Streptomyces sp. NPDC088725]|uniref:hypothetical protein n=1 Tax=Streptomyces sp. NPDC088725 TaxID=3365873 RepID=UPI00382707EC